MIADAEKGEFDLVFFWRLDRLTRNSKDFHKLTEQLHRYNVGIKSANEHIDTTSAVGRFQLELSVSLAQLERETISERVFSVMEERVRKGYRNGSPAPLGYNLLEGKLVVNEAQAEVVKRIFDLYLSGVGFKSIAHELIRSEPALYWSGATIRYIISNPVYIGKIRWNYMDKTSKKTNSEIIENGSHEPIIDEVTFQRAQIDTLRRKKGGKKFTSSYMFSSVLKCGRCGGGMQVQTTVIKGKRYNAYRCGVKAEKGTCDFPSVRENAVVDAFLDLINKLTNKATFDKLTQKDNSTEETKRLSKLEKELEVINKRKKRFQVAYANDLISLDELRQHTQEDKEQEVKIKKEFESVEVQTISHWTKSELINAIKQTHDSWHLIESDRDKKAFIQEAFDSLVIDLVPGEVSGQGRRPKYHIKDFVIRL